MIVLAYLWSELELVTYCDCAYFEPLFNIEEGLNHVWLLCHALPLKCFHFTVKLHDCFDLFVIWVGACNILWLCLFCAPLQHWIRAQPGFLALHITCFEFLFHSHFACIFKLTMLRISAFIRPRQSLIFAYYSCFVKGLKLFDACLWYLMLYPLIGSFLHAILSISTHWFWDRKSVV